MHDPGDECREPLAGNTCPFCGCVLRRDIWITPLWPLEPIMFSFEVTTPEDAMRVEQLVTCRSCAGVARKMAQESMRSMSRRQHLRDLARLDEMRREWERAR